MYGAVVIGGGFYGVSIACYLAKRKGVGSVRLVEREDALFRRASFRNQARVHNGYHYPRNYLTAARSRTNLPRFLADFPSAVVRDWTNVYAIARRNSKVSAKQFIHFCRAIGARLEPAPKEFAAMLNPRMIEAAFLVEEYAFDASRLMEWAAAALADAGVETTLGQRVLSCRRDSGGVTIEIGSDDGGARMETLTARHVFNCTYSGINQLGGGERLRTRLKHEVAEIALVEVPPSLRNFGLTVMDGPFFSTMPFPARGLHSLTHVRYTPHFSWFDEPERDPYETLEAYGKESRIDLMLRDAVRYMPALGELRYRGSMFEVKTVLVKSENDDGRPILLERSHSIPGLFSVLGGKIDNIYDIFAQLDRFDFGGGTA